MIERAKEEGRLIGALAGKAQHAERHVDAGVDMIIAQGAEAGGHTGEVGTMVLIPEIVDAVGPGPGARRRRHRARATDGGGDGTRRAGCVVRFGVAHHGRGRDAPGREAEVPRRHVVSDTLRSRSLTGKPARQLRSAWTDEWDDPGDARAARHAAPADPRRRGAGTHRPCGAPRRAAARSSSPTTSSGRSSAA